MIGRMAESVEEHPAGAGTERVSVRYEAPCLMQVGSLRDLLGKTATVNDNPQQDLGAEKRP